MNSEPCSSSNAVVWQKSPQRRLSMMQRRSSLAARLSIHALLRSLPALWQSRQARMQAGNFAATRSWHTLPALRGYPADRKPLKFRRGLQTELLFDVRAMHIHSFGAEMEPAGNFVCAPAFAV